MRCFFGCNPVHKILLTPALLTMVVLWTADIKATEAATEPEEPPQPRGVVVEAVSEGSALQAANLEVGDLLLSWRSVAQDGTVSETGDLVSPFDWLVLEAEYAPRGVIQLVGERQGEAMTFTVEPGVWDAEVRPVLPPEWLAAYLEGAAKIEANDRGAESVAWLELARAVEGGRLKCWLYLQIGKARAQARRWEQAHAAFRQALAAANEPRARIAVEVAIGLAYKEQGQWMAAREAFSAALEVQSWGESLGLAASHAQLGQVAWEQSAYEEAEKHFQTAFALRRKLAPNSLEMASSWRSLGSIAYVRGQLAEARDHYERALEIDARIDPKSLSVGNTLNNLASVAQVAGDLESAEAYQSRALAIREKLAPGSLLVSHSLHNLGNIAKSGGDLDRAENYYRRSLELRKEISRQSSHVAASLDALGALAQLRGHLDVAEQLLLEALSIQESLAPRGLGVARALASLATVAMSRGDLEGAEASFLHALEIRQEVVPGSLEIAYTLNGLGLIAMQRGDFDIAEERLQQSTALFAELAPGSLNLAASWINLGLVATNRGQLAKGEKIFQRALMLFEHLAPNSLEAAKNLSYLGNIAMSRGNLAAAETYLRRSLAIYEEQAPESLDAAWKWNDLGSIAQQRQNFEAAEEYHQRALAIREKVAPKSLDTAASWNNLALLAEARGEFAKLEERYQRALAIYEEKAPGSLTSATVLANLGEAAHRRGDLAAAESFHNRALSVAEKHAPKGLYAAEAAYHLGIVASDHGDLSSAEERYRQALAIYEQISPESIAIAEALHALGTLHQKRSHLALAAETMERALTALESQISLLGTSHETRGSFRARYGHLYTDAIGVHLQMGQPDLAFHLLERSRAQSFLAMLAERDLLFSSDLPTEITERRGRLKASYDRVQSQIASLAEPHLETDLEPLLATLERLQRQRAALAEEVRQTSTRLANLQYPEPLGTRQAQEILDPGTIMLSYSVGTEATTLFVISRKDGLEVVSLDIGEEDLSRETERFRQLVNERKRPSSKSFSPLISAGKRLFELLVEPAAELVEKSDRLLIVADGPLHQLPFGALILAMPEAGDSARDWHYLVEWKPLHQVLSATVYGELQQLRRRSGDQPTSGLIAAFGDPSFPAAVTRGEVTEPEAFQLRAAVRSFDFQPLPSTRDEVEQNARLYAEDASVYLGAEATEERVKALSPETRRVHFATHGLLDERQPLNSAVVLTLPEKLAEGQDNGLLQVWEIFDQVRLDADLVVLSACQTAQGQYTGGEGLNSLARAFQYAGARSVLATSWRVADPTTSRLMVRFYNHLKAGAAKDEALRAAQIEMISNPLASGFDASAPYYWAAFQLHGDWQ